MKTFGMLLLQLTRWTARIVVFLAFSAGVVVLMLWLAGKFTPKVPVGTDAVQPQNQKFAGRIEKVRLIRLPL